MKRVAFFISFLFLLSLSACTVSDNSPKSLKESGLDIVSTLDYLAESDAYVDLFTGSAKISSIIDEIGKEDYSAPRRIFAITGLEDALLSTLLGDANLNQELKDLIAYKFPSALSSQINALQGVDFLAATSILSYEQSYIFKGLSKPTSYLYLYGGKYAVLVNFKPSEDNIVSASGTFVFNEDFAELEAPQDYTALLEAFGIPNVEITLVD